MKVLILSFSNIDKDPRVLRQISFLKSIKGSSIVLSGLQYHGEHSFIPLLKRQRNLLEKILLVFFNLVRINSLKERQFLDIVSFGKLKNCLLKNRFDIIVSNDLETWPIAFALKAQNNKIKVVLDAHEYYPRHFENDIFWNIMHSSYYKYVCNKYIPMSDKLITVSTGIQKKYTEDYGIHSELILNSPDYVKDLKPTLISDGSVKLIHHGIANSSRKLEKMIRMMDYLEPRFHLYLMLVPTDKAYYSKLNKMSKGKKVTFLDPVPTTQISSFINQFDIGVFLLEPINFNYANALPNKFFEFIQARLAIVVGPSPEMSQIIIKEKIGVVSSTFNEVEVSNSLNKLTIEDINDMKVRSHEISWNYSNQINIKVMSEIFEELYSKKSQL